MHIFYPTYYSNQYKYKDSTLQHKLHLYHVSSKTWNSMYINLMVLSDWKRRSDLRLCIFPSFVDHLCYQNWNRRISYSRASYSDSRLRHIRFWTSPIDRFQLLSRNRIEAAFHCWKGIQAWQNWWYEMYILYFSWYCWSWNRTIK